MKKLLTVGDWVKIAGLTKQDLDTQFKVQIEELTEWLEAETIDDMIDAVCDIIFVANVRAELGEDLRSLAKIEVLIKAIADATGLNQQALQVHYDEVIESNFSKFCSSASEADETVNSYAEKGIEVVSNKVGDYWVIRSAFDQQDSTGKEYPEGKILKSVNFRDPDFTKVITDAMMSRLQ